MENHITEERIREIVKEELKRDREIQDFLNELYKDVSARSIVKNK